MRLISIALENFASFESATLRYPTQGIVAITGINRDQIGADSNMSGKSNLIAEALNWVLFEQTPKQMTPEGTRLKAAKADDVIRGGAQTCRVVLEIEVSGAVWTVERSRSRGSRTTLSLTKEGEDRVAYKDYAEAQQKLEGLIGFSFKTFNQTIMFGQGMKRFTQARDAERKEVLEQLLGLEVYSQARQVAKQQLDAHAAERSALDHEADLIQSRYDALDEQIEDAEAYHKEQVQIHKTWKAELDRRIAEVEAECANLQTEHSEYENELSELTTSNEAIDLKLKKLNPDKIETALESLHTELREFDDQILRLEMTIEQEKQAIRRFSQLSGTCPTCEQTLPETHVADTVANHKKTLDETTRKVRSLEDGRRSVSERVSKWNDRQEEVDQLASKRIATLSRIDSVTRDLDRLTREIGRKQKDLKALRATPSPAAVESVKSKIAALRKRQRELEASSAELDTRKQGLTQKMDDCEFWVKGFGNGGIKSMILDSVIPPLNRRTNELLSILAGGIEVEFDTQSYTATGEARERFDIRVFTGGGEGYHLASGGERKRIDFCVALALQGLQTVGREPSNFYIFDEPFEGMDGTGEEELIEVLRRFADENRAVCFVVSHSRHMGSLFDRHIQVIKQEGVSSILE